MLHQGAEGWQIALELLYIGAFMNQNALKSRLQICCFICNIQMPSQQLLDQANAVACIEHDWQEEFSLLLSPDAFRQLQI